MPNETEHTSRARLDLDGFGRLSAARTIVANGSIAMARAIVASTDRNVEPAVRAALIRVLAELPTDPVERGRVLTRWRGHTP
jgi:hypothetical protein